MEKLLLLVSRFWSLKSVYPDCRQGRRQLDLSSYILILNSYLLIHNSLTASCAANSCAFFLLGATADANWCPLQATVVR